MNLTPEQALEFAKKMDYAGLAKAYKESEHNFTVGEWKEFINKLENEAYNKGYFSGLATRSIEFIKSGERANLIEALEIGVDAENILDSAYVAGLDDGREAERERLIAKVREFLGEERFLADDSVSRDVNLTHNLLRSRLLELLNKEHLMEELKEEGI